MLVLQLIFHIMHNYLNFCEQSKRSTTSRRRLTFELQIISMGSEEDQSGYWGGAKACSRSTENQ